MHLKEPYRLVFMQKNSETVIITEIIDYHYKAILEQIGGG